jgi:GxGYxYP putative glycoside hydrolase C-terminal domain
MGESDLGIAEILDDQDSFNRADLWSAYLQQPNIDALFYFGPGARGQVGWVNSKPVVAQRDVLWEGLTDERTLIQNINSRPATPGTAEGYTLVLVHCWTKSLSDIKTVVDGLGPDVEVVTPQEFVSLIEQNHVHS